VLDNLLFASTGLGERRGSRNGQILSTGRRRTQVQAMTLSGWPKWDGSTKPK